MHRLRDFHTIFTLQKGNGAEQQRRGTEKGFFLEILSTYIALRENHVIPHHRGCKRDGAPWNWLCSRLYSWLCSWLSWDDGESSPLLRGFFCVISASGSIF
jgi:hypothetical protein